MQPRVNAPAVAIKAEDSAEKLIVNILNMERRLEKRTTWPAQSLPALHRSLKHPEQSFVSECSRTPSGADY